MKKARKWINAILVMGLMIGLVPGEAFAAEYIDSADYSIERHDFSWSENGQLKLLHYYDQIVLNETSDQARNINESLKQHYNVFYAEVPEIVSEAQRVPPHFPGQYFRYYYEPEVSKNQDGILSVAMNWYWNFGGVNNYGTDGLNYDLNTGNKLNLSNLFSLSDAEIERYFKDQTLNFISTHPNYPWWQGSIQDAREIVNGYQLEDFNYYVEGNSIVLVYEQYELGPGALGVVKVPCPIINNTIDVTLDGNALAFDQQPIMDNDRVMVPIRAIFEALGYTVDGKQATQTGTATNGDNTITVQGNNAAITYDGGTYWCDVTPKNVSGRILVPIRAISESAGCDVFWNQTMKKVIIEDE